MAMGEETKSLLVTFLYNHIKSIVDQFIGNSGVSLDTNLLLGILGYYKKNTWWGKGLLYGAVASLGSEGGLALGGLFGKKKEEPRFHTLPYYGPAGRLMLRYPNARIHRRYYPAVQHPPFSYSLSWRGIR